MEGPKELASYSSASSSSSSSSRSSTSFHAELSGLKPTAASPARENVFSSIFPLPSKLDQPGEFPKFEVNVNKQYVAEGGWNVKPGKSGGNLKSNESERLSTQKKEASYIYQQQNLQPMHLSSSIYYGGQEIFPRPNNNRDPASNSISLENNNGDDDSGSASRGDWWQGSLYY